MSSGEHPVVRACVVCKKAVPFRPLQALNTRCCGPRCAAELAHREHPDLGKKDWDPEYQN